MSFFVIGYYALLIGASCLAAYFKQRPIFMMLFSLTLISFVVGIIGGHRRIAHRSPSAAGASGAGGGAVLRVPRVPDHDHFGRVWPRNCAPRR